MFIRHANARGNLAEYLWGNLSERQRIEYDFSIYDDDFLSENGEKKELFIDIRGRSVSNS